MRPDLRQRVIAEWRGLPQHQPRFDPPRPIGETLPAVIKRLGLNERLTEAQVLGAWKEIVGEFLGTHSAPAALRDGILFVHVLQPTVHYELDRVWKKEILQKLRTRLGSKVVRDIRFRLG